MLKLQLIIQTIYIVVALSGEFDDVVERNKQVVNAIWRNNFSLPADPKAYILDLVYSDVVPIAWVNDSVIGSYVERNNRKAFVLTDNTINWIVAKTCDASCMFWRNLVFNNVSSSNLVDPAGYYALPESKRKDRVVLVTARSTKYSSEQLYQEWLDGKFASLILKSQGGLTSNQELLRLATHLGISFNRNIVTSPSLSNLEYVSTGRLVSYSMILKKWTEDMNSIVTYPEPIDVQYEKYPLLAEDIYAFMKKYDEMLQTKSPTVVPIIPNGEIYNYTIDFFKLYTKFSYSQTLKNIDAARLSALTFQYGYAGGYSNEELPEPEVGEYTVTILSKGMIASPTGLDQKPHTVIEYEILTDNATTCVLLVGAMTDYLMSKTSLRRVPITRSSDSMVNKMVGRFYSPVGGPILVSTGSYIGEVKIKFRNVYQAAGINIRDPSSKAVWDSGRFNNTRARFVTLICDVIFFIVEMSTLKNETAQTLEEICIVNDHVVKSFANFVDEDITIRERYQIVFDPQPSIGMAHAGQPIVLGFSWSGELVNMANYYIRRTNRASYWGFLHEIGHMFQPNEWEFGIFGETTNNVLALMFLERYFKTNWDERIYHAAILNINNLSNRINTGKGMDDTWGGAHFHYHLVPSFGWALFGNVYHRYREEPSSDFSFDRFLVYLSEESGFNMAPYSYYFRFSYLSPNITAVYDRLKHLPTYKPYDLILNTTTKAWDDTKIYFGFNNDVQVVKILPFKFETDKGFNHTDPISPIVVKN